MGKLCCYAEFNSSYIRDGVPIGDQADSEWLYVVPWGLRRLLNYVNKRYHHPTIYITESGVDVPNENSIPYPKVLEDHFRINYYKVLNPYACPALCYSSAPIALSKADQASGRQCSISSNPCNDRNG